MLKTLLKKQFLSVYSKLGTRGQGGRKNGNAKGYLVVIALLVVLLGAMFFSMGAIMAKPLADAGMGWLYFVYAGLMALGMSVIGSIFMTQSCLYEAKDNELMISLPIPSRYILFVRMVPLYVQNFLFGLVVLLPASICWGLVAPVSVGQAFIWIIIMLTQPFLSLFITCLLGLALALITNRLRDKTLVTVILSIGFIFLYFILYAQIMNYINAMITNSAAIGSGIKSHFYPLYMFGAACMGDFVGLLVTVAIEGGLFGALYLVLSKTYIKLVTTRRGGASAKYDGRVAKKSSQLGALLKKETRRFFGNGMYFLNSGLGVILLILVTVLFIINNGKIAETLSFIPGISGLLAPIAIFVIGFLCVMDEVSAPSISLEGKNLWIVQSMPVDLWLVLKSKLLMHYLVTAPVATLCSAIFAIVIRPSPLMGIFMVLAPSILVMLSGVVGLIFNLKKPNLIWDNEIVVLKQSLSVLLTMLSCLGALIVLAVLFVLMSMAMAAELSMFLCLLLAAGLVVGLALMLRKKGPATLARL